MATMPSNYFNRFDPAKNYTRHLFIAGRGLQSAELNELQSRSKHHIRGIADAIFKDGDIVRDAVAVVNKDTGEVQCQAGALYIAGEVRGVEPAAFVIPTVGDVAIGIRIVTSVVTSTEDPDLKDPATGTRNYNLPGAERLRDVASWGWDGDGGEGEFFPVYGVTDGNLNPKEAPPSTDAMMQALARYDRDSAGGTYVVSGLRVTRLVDEGVNQVYSMSEGRARVYGYGLEFPTSRRVVHAAAPDLKPIMNEPHLSSTASAQRIEFHRSPATAITEVSITAEKTVTLTHGVSTGASDPLPDTSVLSIEEVKQGATTFTPTTDYLLTAGKVDWSPGGAEPAPGSTYTVKYRYIATVTPTDVDDDGFTVEGAVAGTLVQVSYSQKLPRYDRLCLTTDGRITWLIGVSAEWNPSPPKPPADVLSVATVYQTWRAGEKYVLNDGTRMVPMPDLAAVEGKLDWMIQQIARTRLESSIHSREAGAKKGLFADPMLDDSQRDAGTPQTGAIVDGELMLPISAVVHQMPADVETPQTLPYTLSVELAQELRSGSMKINPYQAFDPLPGTATLKPAVDHWTQQVTTWLSPETRLFVVDNRILDAWHLKNFGAGFDKYPSSVSTTVTNEMVGRTVTNVEHLRQIEVKFKLSRFGPGETLSTVKFDGVEVTPEAL